MTREQATREIKERWRDIYQPDRRGGIICPLCGSGSGKNGSGITEMKTSGQHFLKCWNGGCTFEKGGSVIDLYMIEQGMEGSKADFARAVDQLAARLGITIEGGRPSTAGGKSLAWGAVIGGNPSSSAHTGRTEAADGTEGSPSFSGQPFPSDAPSEATEAAQRPAEATNERGNDAALDLYTRRMQRLCESHEAQAYLQERGISLETALAYGVGYEPEWVSPTVIRNMRAQGKDWRPAPKPAIIFASSLEHYVARDIRPLDQLDETQQKFVKMNEGKPGLFGWDIARDSGAQHVFIVEGAFDALSVAEVGGQAVALNSTSNAEKLLEAVKAHPPKATLILALDADEAGRKTTNILKDGLRRLNVSFTAADICGGHGDPNEALTADREAFKAAVERAITAAGDRPDSVSEYIDSQMFADIERFKLAADRKTGFANLDEKAGGLNAGLYVLASISSLGKTTFALQMADQLAAAGEDVLFFSMEQSRLELVSKSLARLTKQAGSKTAVTSLSIRKGSLPSQVLAAADIYKARTGDRMSIIEGNFACDIGFIADYVRRYVQRTGKRPVVFIDYLQILQPSREGNARTSKKDEIDIAVTELKRMSREMELTVVIISSINRANYLTPFSFESLKESGGIEYTADVVWGLQLACLDEDIFANDTGITAKRNRIAKAKAEIPRKIKFVCKKNRYGISEFDCYFSYEPAYDLFIPTPPPPPAKKEGGKR